MIAIEESNMQSSRAKRHFIAAFLERFHQSLTQLVRCLATVLSGQHLEHIVTACASLFPILLCILIIQLRNLSGPLFQHTSNDGWFQGWIDTCRFKAAQYNPDPGNPNTVNQAINFTGTGIDEKSLCSTFIRCILTQATQDYPAYWSASSSILAFIPTIVGLLSNSIEEIVAISFESPLLGLLLALSSTTSFSSRFTESQPPQTFERHPDYVLAVQQGVVDYISKNLRHARRRDRRGWVENENMHTVVVIIGLAGCTVGVWYFVWFLSRYGVVVWSCPTKIHTPVWIALSQTLVVLNIAFRSWLFRTEQIRLRISNGEANSARMSREHDFHTEQNRRSSHESHESHDFQSDETYKSITVLLRCRRRGLKRWVVQTITSIISFGLYTFATVFLASMTFITPVKAISVMVAFSVAGGVGRLAGYWARSSLRVERRVLLFDVSEKRIGELRDRLEMEVTLQDSEIDLTEEHVPG
ncbi:hypothetical protein EV356DRAFT_294875 [Viridothelium virens]|uniref:Uncharacterized protein n=1 Tax=Viridothelium virens TaxID=1048519 RepID=A0A6A6H086_VIRVR|nr:hypothetical protein EV356DRAFT_294875 [Viridothelium virens]